MNTPRRPLPGNIPPPPPADEPEQEFAELLLGAVESVAMSLQAIAYAQSSLALLRSINADDNSDEAKQAREVVRALAMASAALSRDVLAAEAEEAPKGDAT